MEQAASSPEKDDIQSTKTSKDSCSQVLAEAASDDTEIHTNIKVEEHDDDTVATNRSNGTAKADEEVAFLNSNPVAVATGSSRKFSSKRNPGAAMQNRFANWKSKADAVIQNSEVLKSAQKSLNETKNAFASKAIPLQRVRSTIPSSSQDKSNVGLTNQPSASEEDDLSYSDSYDNESTATSVFVPDDEYSVASEASSVKAAPRRRSSIQFRRTSSSPSKLNNDDEVASTSHRGRYTDASNNKNKGRAPLFQRLQQKVVSARVPTPPPSFSLIKRERQRIQHPKESSEHLVV